jgi:predicted Ser/Thr protein kinase
MIVLQANMAESACALDVTNIHKYKLSDIEKIIMGNKFTVY